MNLDPAVLTHHLTVLGIVPSLEMTGTETAGVYSEVGFNGLERAGAFLHKHLEDRRELGVVKVVEDAVVVRRLGHVALGKLVAHVAGGATARDGGVDLEHGGE